MYLITGSRDRTARVYSREPIPGFVPVTLGGHRDTLVAAWFAGASKFDAAHASPVRLCLPLNVGVRSLIHGKLRQYNDSCCAFDSPSWLLIGGECCAHMQRTMWRTQRVMTGRFTYGAGRPCGHYSHTAVANLPQSWLMKELTKMQQITLRVKLLKEAV
jgi:hypothetical protein